MSIFQDIPSWAFNITYGIFMLAMFIVFLHMKRASSILERILALDLLTSIVMCLAIVISIEYKNTVFLQVSLCISIVAFLGTAAFARYIGEKSQ